VGEDLRGVERRPAVGHLLRGPRQAKRDLADRGEHRVVVALGASVGFLTGLGAASINDGWVVALLTGGVIAAPVAAWIVKHLPAGCWVSPPVGSSSSPTRRPCWGVLLGRTVRTERAGLDRKSTRLNSSHVSISYAVFCLKR